MLNTTAWMLLLGVWMPECYLGFKPWPWLSGRQPRVLALDIRVLSGRQSLALDIQVLSRRQSRALARLVAALAADSGQPGAPVTLLQIVGELGGWWGWGLWLWRLVADIVVLDEAVVLAEVVVTAIVVVDDVVSHPALHD